MKKDKEALIKKALERFSDVYTADKEERAAADEDIKFAVDDGGCQWPQELRDAREKSPTPRPCITVNKIPEKIDQADGEFRQSAPAIKIRPVDSKADPKKAEIYGGLIRCIEYNSAAKHIYNQAYTQVLHGGRAAWRINTAQNEEDPFVKDLVLEPIPNVFTVYFDDMAKRADKSDKRFCFVTEWLSEDDFKEQYPGVDLAGWDAGDDDQDNWRDGKKVRVAQYWYKVKKTKKVYKVERLENGFTAVKIVDELMEGDREIDSTEVEKTSVKYCTMIHNEIIDGPHDWPGKYIPIVMVFGKTINISGKNKSRGMVRFAKDPQRLYNYWSSIDAEQGALAPKAPYLLTSKMLGPYKDMWDTAGTESWPYLVYDPDPTAPAQRPMREQPPQASSFISNALARGDHDLMSSMGMYQSSLGDEGQEKSGRAIIARKQQGNIGTFAYVDNFAIGLTFSGKILLDLIPYVYDTERIISIMGEDGSFDMVPVNAKPNSQILQQRPISQDLLSKDGDFVNDMTIGKYDMQVTIGPSYTTQREETLAMMVDFIGKVPKAGEVIPDLVAKNIDMPGNEEMVKRLRKTVPIEVRDPDPEEQQAQKKAQQQPDPQMIQMQAELQIKQREQDRKDFETQIKAMKDFSEMQARATDDKLKKLEFMLREMRGASGQESTM